MVHLLGIENRRVDGLCLAATRDAVSRNVLDRVHGAGVAGTGPRRLEGKRSEHGMVVEIPADRPPGDGMVGMEEPSRGWAVAPIRVARRATIGGRPE
jgi:hypothetical protein